jgi:hypothetical protein
VAQLVTHVAAYSLFFFCIPTVCHSCRLCKDPWEKHGSSSGGYYVCNKYEASAKEGKLSAEERSNIDSQKLLQKYTYYYKRYKSSWDAIALTKKLGEKLEKSLKNSDLQKYSFMSVDDRSGSGSRERSAARTATGSKCELHPQLSLILVAY